MEQQKKPLAQSDNVKTIVSFSDMPEEYVMVDRNSMADHPHAEELFAANPTAKTLMLLYAENGDLRSAYQSPAAFADGAENGFESFYHVSGEKLVNLVLGVACDLSAYGQSNVMIPQLATNEEIRSMAKNRAQSISLNMDDPFEFQEDWSTVDGLRINRVVEVVRGSGRNNARNVAVDIPVEFAPRKSGDDVFDMLKAAERGDIIPPEVFMYAAALQAQKSGGDFDQEFIEGLKDRASIASRNATNAVHEHVATGSPLDLPQSLPNEEAETLRARQASQAANENDHGSHDE